MTITERDTQEVEAQAAPDEHEPAEAPIPAVLDLTLYAELVHVPECELRALWGDR